MNFLKRLFRRKNRVEIACLEDFLSPANRRLAAGAELLHEIEFERRFRDDPSFGRATEDRIIWRELFDLELQEVDAELSRIREAE